MYVFTKGTKQTVIMIYLTTCFIPDQVMFQLNKVGKRHHCSTPVPSDLQFSLSKDMVLEMAGVNRLLQQTRNTIISSESVEFYAGC